MAKLEAKVNVVVYGDPFSQVSPQKREALADKLSCTDWQDEPTYTGSWSTGWACEDNGSLAPVFGSQTLTAGPAKRSPAEILAEAINRAGAMLPHGIELRSERRLARLCYEVTATCPHCGVSVPVVEFAEHVVVDTIGVEWLAAMTRESVHVRMRPCIEATCCDPLDRYVDGLRVRECLERYTQDQRKDRGPSSWRGKDGSLWFVVTLDREHQKPLTALQKAAAQQAWSAQLRARQAQAREKERCEVVVERDEDGL